MPELLPIHVNNVEVVFGGDMAKLLPAWRDIPEEIRSERDPWSPVVHKWFFGKLKALDWTPKAGINRTLAIRHVRAILVSFEPKHEHKIAACAHLLALWFETPEEQAQAYDNPARDELEAPDGA